MPRKPRDMWDGIQGIHTSRYVRLGLRGMQDSEEPMQGVIFDTGLRIWRLECDGCTSRYMLSLDFLNEQNE